MHTYLGFEKVAFTISYVSFKDPSFDNRSKEKIYSYIKPYEIADDPLYEVKWKFFKMGCSKVKMLTHPFQQEKS